MTDTIVIYDIASGMPRYTVEPPYPETTIAFYEDLVSTDGTIGLCLSPTSNIVDKCVLDVEGVMTLSDRPEQTDVSGSLSGSIYTITGIYPNSQLLVDNTDIYDLTGETTASITLDSVGTYSLVLICPPYLDKQFTVTV